MSDAESTCEQRPTLLVYNTVERLLRGDFYHSVALDALRGDLGRSTSECPIVGLGTSNWFDRHGELIVDGSAGEPSFWWGDPTADPPGRLVDLLHDRPPASDRLVTPVVGAEDERPQFPFVTVALCRPGTETTREAPAGVEIHEWLVAWMRDANIGLAAARAEAPCETVRYTTLCHIPAGGIREDAEGRFEHGASQGKSWSLRGVYATNPTIQDMVSVPGSPLHLHGYSATAGIGGHVAAAHPEKPVRVTVWPIKDLVLRIHNLDVAWLPTKELSAREPSRDQGSSSVA